MHLTPYTPKASIDIFKRLRLKAAGKCLDDTVNIVISLIRRSGYRTAHTEQQLRYTLLLKAQSKCGNNDFLPDINTPLQLPVLCLDIQERICQMVRVCALIGSFASTVLIRMSCCPFPGYLFIVQP